MNKFVLDPAGMTDAQRDTLAWAAREVAPWRAKGLDRRAVEAAFAELAEQRPEMFIFQISEGVVGFRPKMFVEKSDKINTYMLRATQYLAFFQAVVDAHCGDLDTTICVSMADGVLADGASDILDVPCFCFQKQSGRTEMMLPDIDFITQEFYEDGKFTDTMVYDHKRDRAVFTGSTTGGLITLDVARRRATQRLDAGTYFYGDPDVSFTLPSIVQYDSEETLSVLRDLPFCGGEAAAWAEQCQNKFLISMDGNGAACSRLAVALHSNSVLLKYTSSHKLFYFDGLQPWKHYIPVDRHHEVKTMIETERASPGTFAHIAAAGRAFAQTYLTRENIFFYTAALFSVYDQCFTLAKEENAEALLQSPSAILKSLQVVLRIWGHGEERYAGNDWIGLSESGRFVDGLRIEEMCIEAPDELAGLGISYCVASLDGTVSDWESAGEFCGISGQKKFISGFYLSFDGEEAKHLNLSYTGVFADGTVSPLVPAGELCGAPSTAALEAMRLVLTLKDDAAGNETPPQSPL